MFESLDAQQTLTANQKKLIVAGGLGVLLEFLDYFLIGFILTFVAKPWGLTMGKSSSILLSSGAGAIAGAFFFGLLADRIGRRLVFLSTIAVFTLGTSAMVFTPDSPDTGWIYLTAMRFLVGFGAGGLYCVDLPLVQEFMPSRLRARVSGLITSMVPFSFLMGSALVALLSSHIGWRGLLIICVAFSLATLFLRRWIPESPRWLIQQGRSEEARKSMAWALEVDVDSLAPIMLEPKESQPKVGLKDLFRYPRSLAVSWISNLGIQTGYYGLTLWSPTLLVVFLGVSPQKAAVYMIFITCCAFAGRIVQSFFMEWFGRRLAGILSGGITVIAMLVVALLGNTVLTTPELFLICLGIIYFFGEGGFAVIGPYSAEVWPSSLRTTGMGSAYGFGGIGKVLGPLGLALLVGTDVSLTTSAAIQPSIAFMYFSVWYLMLALAFVFFGIETRGRSIEEIDASLRNSASKSQA
ncbi:MAG: MFS transporter [Betaproteobacteria bacterium]|nr:MFS transporter [Betaproteobacteria bacterium]